MIKETASDSATEPNLLTEVLEDMFGPQGYQPERGNQVRIYPLADEPDVWVIEPHRQGSIARVEATKRIPSASAERTSTIPKAHDVAKPGAATADQTQTSM
ncbi:hypothetical protein D3C87_1736150 [compost metagenome]